MITARNVVGGVVRALRKAFPECEVYTENVNQGLSPPCFSVICGELFFHRIVGKRFSLRFDLCVYYYPKKDKVFSEIGGVWEKLFPALEVVEVDGDLIRGDDFSTKIVDDVMVLCVSYNAIVYDGEKAPAMGEINFSSKL